MFDFDFSASTHLRKLNTSVVTSIFKISDVTDRVLWCILYDLVTTRGLINKENY